MAKITDLAVIHALGGDETLPMVQDGVTRRVNFRGMAASMIPFLPVAFKGDPGAAGNVAANLVQLKAAPIAADTMLWGGVPFSWETRRAPYTADEDQPYVTTVKSIHQPLTVGAWVRQSAAGISFLQAGASVVRDQQSKARESKSVLDFGAIADGTVHKVSEWIGAGKRYASLAALQADYPHVTSIDDYIDWAAIQATIDYLGANHGGTALLPKVDGRYIINRGLKLKSSTCIRGAYPARFGYNGGNAKSSALVADFADPMQWVIDTDSRSGGQPLGLRDLYSAALPDGAIYDCGVYDLAITSIGNLPYGGVRIAGAPGSNTGNLYVHRTGIGLLVNMAFGGNFQALCLTAYYGFIGFNDYNGNNADVYVARASEYSGDIPAQYQFWPFTDMAPQLNGPTYGLSTNAHATRAIGVMIGGNTSTSNNNTIAFVCERFDIGELAINTYSLSHTKAYVEASDMKTVFVAAQSTFSHSNVHAYTSGTGVVFDLGKGVDADMRLNGSVFTGGFGSVTLDGTARVLLRGVTLDQFGPTVPQYNISYEAPGNWRPVTYQNGWGTAANAFPLRYRKEGRRVWLQGSVVGGSVGTVIGVIPPGWRPAMRADDFGKVLVAATGEINADSGGAISINLSWEAAQ